MKTISERFWEKVQKAETCWLWTGALSTRGHGVLRKKVNGNWRTPPAHRISWEIHFGPIPPGKPVEQTCGARTCVRPDHLRLGDCGVIGPSMEDRFWSRVKKGGPDDCWEWQKGFFEYGYGKLKVDGLTKKAHRISWELHHGAIPEGLLVLHHCDNPPCVNPAHLFLGTHQDNHDDRIAKGRPSPQSTKTTTLSTNDVHEIRRLKEAGAKQADIATRFHVTLLYVNELVNYRARKNG